MNVTLALNFFPDADGNIPADEFKTFPDIAAALGYAKRRAVKPAPFSYTIVPEHPSIGWNISGWSSNLNRKGRDLASYLWGAK